jgi:hypothetical protein
LPEEIIEFEKNSFFDVFFRTSYQTTQNPTHPKNPFKNPILPSELPPSNKRISRMPLQTHPQPNRKIPLDMEIIQCYQDLNNNSTKELSALTQSGLILQPLTASKLHKVNE